MEIEHIRKLTLYQDINEVLYRLAQGIIEIVGKDTIGLYLFGSLSYDDFNPERSDIDLLVIVKNPVSEKKIKSLKKLHLEIEKKNKEWSKRIECSYTPLEMFSNTLPPKSPRPYYGEGVFYPEAEYGNEWLINNYLLYNQGITLLGPDFKNLVKPIDIVDVQKACIRDLFKEWKPKITDSTYLNNSHYQSYTVLNLCRILYTVIRSSVASKSVSASWVKNEFAPKWKSLIEIAEDWSYGVEMNLKEETIEFIKFVVDKVKEKQF